MIYGRKGSTKESGGSNGYNPVRSVVNYTYSFSDVIVTFNGSVSGIDSVALLGMFRVWSVSDSAWFFPNTANITLNSITFGFASTPGAGFAPGDPCVFYGGDKMTPNGFNNAGNLV